MEILFGNIGLPEEKYSANFKLKTDIGKLAK